MNSNRYLLRVPEGKTRKIVEEPICKVIMAVNFSELTKKQILRFKKCCMFKSESKKFSTLGWIFYFLNLFCTITIIPSFPFSSF